MTLRDLLAAIALTVGVVGAVSAWMEQPGSIAVAPGRNDAGLYAVTPLDDEAPIAAVEGSTLLPVAAFETRGRVLNIERFRPRRSLANWVPGLRPSTHDIGLGYGPMSDTANVERFRFSHEGASNGLRALFARPRVPMTQSEFDALAPHITNVHVIPASPAIYDELRNIRHGELVTLRGKLVNVRDRDGTLALTSTTPGDRDCEILWLEHVRRGRL